MNRYEKLIVILPALADAVPFVYLLVAPKWPNVPDLVVLFCSFAPLIIGILVLISLPTLKHRNLITKSSDSARIAIVLATIGLIEPFFY